MTNLKLSVIDIGCPSGLRRLVPLLDSLGYHRFWTTEHHSPRQSSSPAVAVSFAASISQRMRVGAAGVMLNLYSPARITEDFRLLELLFPGRIDLGVVPATPGTAFCQAIMEQEEPDFSRYGEKLRELMRLVGYEAPSGHGTDGRQLGPVSETITPVWVCGGSKGSAQLCGELGGAFAFHHSMNQHRPSPVNGPEVIRAYIDAFRPTPQRARPEFNIACFGSCAATEQKAKEQWQNQLAANGAKSGKPAFLGSPSQCVEQLQDIAHQYEADEIVIDNYTADFEEKLDAYTAIANVGGVTHLPVCEMA